MAAYINRDLLEDLFDGVELKVNVSDRLDMIRSMTDTFVSLAVTSLERVVYDLKVQGWSDSQVADEIGVGRAYIVSMAAAYANRTGLPAVHRSTRSYDHAVDISRLVSREARARHQATPPPSSQ